MKLEDFVVDQIIKTTTYENNFKHLMKEKNIKKIFPEASFHGKDETFQYEDGKSLFKEAIEFDPEKIEQKTKKSEISPGYSLNKLKRKRVEEDDNQENSISDSKSEEETKEVIKKKIKKKKVKVCKTT